MPQLQQRGVLCLGAGSGLKSLRAGETHGGCVLSTDETGERLLGLGVTTWGCQPCSLQRLQSFLEAAREMGPGEKGQYPVLPCL